MTIKDRLFLGVTSSKPHLLIYLLEDTAPHTLRPVISLNLTLPHPLQWDLHIGNDNKRVEKIEKALDSMSAREV